MDFKKLVSKINDIHVAFKRGVYSTVNSAISYKNWFIGYYIVEYEQNGEDRAKYGDNVITELEKELQSTDTLGLKKTNLYSFRQFYLLYPQIQDLVNDELKKPNSILQTVSGKLDSVNLLKELPPTNEDNKEEIVIPGEILITRLSFSHFVELMKIKNSNERLFYEMSSIQGNWSIRELRRQISSNYFERSGLSKNKQALSILENKSAEKIQAKHIVNDNYFFEFFGLKQREVLQEYDLEKVLLAKLEDFMLELGHGFCFEGRYKPIIIKGKEIRVPLVFYHRILKCHVLVELKVDSLRGDYAAKLAAELKYYRENEKYEGDRDPIGLLLVTNKENAVVEYLLDGSDENLFVREYKVELPEEKEIVDYIKKEIKKL